MEKEIYSSSSPSSSFALPPVLLQDNHHNKNPPPPPLSSVSSSGTTGSASGSSTRSVTLFWEEAGLPVEIAEMSRKLRRKNWDWRSNDEGVLRGMMERVIVLLSDLIEPKLRNKSLADSFMKYIFRLTENAKGILYCILEEMKDDLIALKEERFEDLCWEVWWTAREVVDKSWGCNNEHAWWKAHPNRGEGLYSPWTWRMWRNYVLKRKTMFDVWGEGSCEMIKESESEEEEIVEQNTTTTVPTPKSSTEDMQTQPETESLPRTSFMLPAALAISNLGSCHSDSETKKQNRTEEIEDPYAADVEALSGSDCDSPMKSPTQRRTVNGGGKRKVVVDVADNNNNGNGPDSDSDDDLAIVDEVQSSAPKRKRVMLVDPRTKKVMGITQLEDPEERDYASSESGESIVPDPSLAFLSSDED